MIRANTDDVLVVSKHDFQIQLNDALSTISVIFIFIVRETQEAEAGQSTTAASWDGFLGRTPPTSLETLLRNRGISGLLNPNLSLRPRLNEHVRQQIPFEQGEPGTVRSRVTGSVSI